MKNDSAFATAVLFSLAAAACGGATTTRASAPSMNACNGLAAQDREAAAARIDEGARARVLKAEKRFGRVTMLQTTGAEVYVPAERGMTEPWLQRVADCKIAEHAVAQNASASPLAVPGASADVVPGRAGFRVRITHEDPESAREIARRATEPTVAIEQVAQNDVQRVH